MPCREVTTPCSRSNFDSQHPEGRTSKPCMTMPSGISSLFLFHTPSNVGYAIGQAESIFFRVGMELAGSDSSKVHFGFRDLDGGHPRSLPLTFKNLISYNYYDRNKQNIHYLTEYARQNQIELVVLYDIQPVDPLFRPLKKAGVRAILSYWGATISSRMPLWKLMLKRLEIALAPSRLDGLIFQSQAMADLAIYGRGVPRSMIDIVYSGVDISLFRPQRSTYVYDLFGFPRDKKVIVYSGHMEARKGTETLMRAAVDLLHRRKRPDVCFLLCGNKGNESEPLQQIYAGLGLDSLIKFAGYRSDMDKIYPSCFCGVIPTSGWDSFPRSPVEMAASGLPVIASRIDGLPESVLDGQTGLLCQPGSAPDLADCIEKMLDHPEIAAEFGRRGRDRCEKELNRDRQCARLRELFLKRLAI